MKRILSYLVFNFLFIGMHAQVTVEEIKLVPESEFHKSKNATVIYPVITTRKKDVDHKINQRIISEVSGSDSTKNIREILMLQMEEGLRSLDYKITLHTKQVLSIKITGLGCGAHCSSWQHNFNFNVATGELFTIEDVITKSEIDNFTLMVSRDKMKALKQHRLQMDSLLSKRAIDSATHEFVIEYMTANCSHESNPEIFLLTEEGIQIFAACEFPNVAKALEPIIELKYSYKEMKKFINPAFGFYSTTILHQNSDNLLQSH